MSCVNTSLLSALMPLGATLIISNITGGPEYGWNSQWTGCRWVTAVSKSLKEYNSVLRFSSGSESGAPPCERFM